MKKELVENERNKIYGRSNDVAVFQKNKLYKEAKSAIFKQKVHYFKICLVDFVSIQIYQGKNNV